MSDVSQEARFYEPPEDRAGTVFDPCDETFGPIMAALQDGAFERARDWISRWLLDEPRGMLEIAYHGEAGDSFQTAIGGMEGYTVRVVPDGDNGPVEDPFDARLLGVDLEAGWYGALRVQPLNEDGDGEAIGDERSVIARRVEVY